MQRQAGLDLIRCTVLLFVSLYQMQLSISAEKLLAFAAKGCYGGYLLSHLLDAWCYGVFPQWRMPAYYLLQFLVITVPIYITSILAGSVLEQLAGRVLLPREG